LNWNFSGISVVTRMDVILGGKKNTLEKEKPKI
jgi:hypothetical protein